MKRNGRIINFLAGNIVLFSGLMLLLQPQLRAQQTILLNSGEKKTAYRTSIDDKQDILFYTDKKGAVKWEYLQDVFSLTREDSVHIIFYKPDCEDVCFRIHQMRDYLTGYADANNEPAWLPFTSGLITGGGFSFYFVSVGLSVLAPLPPAANALIFGGIRPNPDNFNIHPEMQDNAHYTEGFLNGLKRRRSRSSILGGAAGLIGGATTALLLK